ncbi:hypothetical protein N7453_011819 [Penicillium expansum]|nr:hypothetical protein N7453_011819 [Penicillium expansum]
MFLDALGLDFLVIRYTQDSFADRCAIPALASDPDPLGCRPPPRWPSLLRASPPQPRPPLPTAPLAPVPSVSSTLSSQSDGTTKRFRKVPAPSSCKTRAQLTPESTSMPTGESTAISPSASTDIPAPLSGAELDPAGALLPPSVDATVDIDRVTYGLLAEILGIVLCAPSCLDMGD